MAKLVNPSNEFLVQSVVMLVRDLDRNHNAFLYDVYMALKELRDKAGEDYPRCGTCYRSANGVTKGCAECRTRHPEYYVKAYGEFK